MVSRRFTAHIDARPVREPQFPHLLTSAIIRVDGSRIPSPDPEEGPRDDPFGPPDRAAPRDIVPNADTSADYIETSDGNRVRWIDGFAYRPEICNGGDVIDPWGSAEGTPPAPGTGGATTNQGLQDEIDVVPFVVEGVIKQSLFGAPTADVYAENRDFALRELLACRSKQIEAELWKGTASIAAGWGNRHLNDANVVLPEGAALLGYSTALAVLEHAIADGSCSQQGVIHARADTVSLWDQGGALRRVGNLILTINDTIVIPGRGYDGSAPVSLGLPVPSADSAWAYATTVPEVFLSDVFHDQAIGERVTKSSNDLTTYARQAAAVTWGCLQAGVRVNHDTALTITGS